MANAVSAFVQGTTELMVMDQDVVTTPSKAALGLETARDRSWARGLRNLARRKRGRSEEHWSGIGLQVLSGVSQGLQL